MIVRPATKTPLSALALGEIALEAGCPPAAVSVVPSSTADAERLAADPRIDFLSFTGSPEVGWHLKGVAGRKRVALEHGGNAAVIVEPDADLATATARCVQGGFGNAGQVCLSVQRILLHASVYDDGLARIVEGARALQVGDPRDPAVAVGPMVSEAAAARAEATVRAGPRRRRALRVRRHPRGHALCADRADRYDAGDGGECDRDLRPGRHGHSVPTASRRRWRSRTTRCTG